MEGVDVCVELENDEFFRKYLNRSLPTADGNVSVSEQVERLSSGVERLDAHLERQVLLKHTDLLARAGHATDLQSELAGVHAHTQRLTSGTEQLRDSIHAQHGKLATHTRALENALSTCHLLRHAARVVALRRQLDCATEPPAQALILTDMEQLLGDYDLAGIYLLDDIINEVQARRTSLLDSATRELHASLAGGDRARLLKAFKLLHSMQRTQQQVDSTVAEVLSTLRRRIRTALDSQPDTEHKKTSRGPGKASIVSSEDLKQCLWENVEKLFRNELHAECSKIVMLQHALSQLHVVGKFRNIARTFWEELCGTFAKELEDSSVTVNQCVEIDFPRLLKCFNDLLLGLKCKELELKRDSFARWENAFLSKSLGKLLESVRSMWLPQSVPTAEQIDRCVRAVSAALSVSLGDVKLSVALAGSVAKAVRQMYMEVEQRTAVDAEAAQIIEAPTAAQQKNVELCNALYHFTSQISRVLSNMKSLPPESATVVRASLADATGACVLQPLAAAVLRSLQLILATAHAEPDLARGDPPPENVSCSLYMKELQQFAARCRHMYLAGFADVASVDAACAEVARCAADRFVHHAVNVKPLSRYGVAKLRADCRQLETALRPLAELDALGESGRRVRALHALLAMTPDEMVASQEAGAVLANSQVAMLLMSLGSEELVQPHVCAGWNVPRLMAWLDAHPSERDRIELVAGALQRYRVRAARTDQAEYDPHYPLALRLLQLATDAK